MTKEIWVDIEGFEGIYQVSNLGRVKSLKRPYRKEDRILKYGTTHKGYRNVQLVGGTYPGTKNVHRIVAKAFIPNPEGKKEVNHEDGDKSNNAVSNLTWSTKKENEDHAKRTDLKAFGSRIGVAKLTEEEIPDILEMIAAGETLKKIGEKYSVSGATISRIKTGKTWVRVTK